MIGHTSECIGRHLISCFHCLWSTTLCNHHHHHSEFHPFFLCPNASIMKANIFHFLPLIIILLDKLPLLFIIVMITFIIIIIIYSSLSQLKHACQKLISLITTKLNFIYLIHWFLNDARRESIYLVDHILPRTFNLNDKTTVAAWKIWVEYVMPSNCWCCSIYILMNATILGYQLIFLISSGERKKVVGDHAKFQSWSYFLHADAHKIYIVNCLCALLLPLKFLCTICNRDGNFI